MASLGNFQRPNTPPAPPQLSDEEKRQAEKKRQFEEEMRRAQAALKEPGRDVFVRSTALALPGAGNTRSGDR